MEANEPHTDDILGFRCLYCSRIFLTSQGIAGHQKAHQSDENWRKGTHHERVFVPKQRSHPKPSTLVNCRAPMVLTPTQVISKPTFAPPRASVVSSNPIPNPLGLRVWRPSIFPRANGSSSSLMPNLSAFSTNVKGFRPFTSVAMPPNHRFVHGFHYQTVMENHKRSVLQPAESQGSSDTVIDGRVKKNKIEGKGVEVNQQLKNKIDLELRL